MICKIGMKKLIGIVFIFCALALPAQNVVNIGQFNRPQNNPYNPNELLDIQQRNNAIINDSEHLQAEIQRQSAIKSLTADPYLSTPINALIMKSEYESRLVRTLAYLLDAENPDILKEKSPEAYQHYEKRQAIYQQIDDLGYEELPEEIYGIWLKHIAKLKTESAQQKTTLMQTIK
jgi:hypothetical protein